MADEFDETLISTAQVFMRPSSTDAYGHSTQLTVVADNTGRTSVPCRVSLGRGRAKEFQVEVKAAVNYRTIFMRPWFDAQNNKLSRKNWLMVDNQLYDIIQVDDPSRLGHHYEVFCEMVLT